MKISELPELPNGATGTSVPVSHGGITYKTTYTASAAEPFSTNTVTQTLANNQASVTFSGLLGRQYSLVCDFRNTVEGVLNLTVDADANNANYSRQIFSTFSTTTASNRTNARSISYSYPPNSSYCSIALAKMMDGRFIASAQSSLINGASGSELTRLGLFHAATAMAEISLSAGSGLIVAGSTFSLKRLL